MPYGYRTPTKREVARNRASCYADLARDHSAWMRLCDLPYNPPYRCDWFNVNGYFLNDPTRPVLLRGSRPAKRDQGLDRTLCVQFFARAVRMFKLSFSFTIEDRKTTPQWKTVKAIQDRALKRWPRTTWYAGESWDVNDRYVSGRVVRHDYPAQTDHLYGLTLFELYERERLVKSIHSTLGKLESAAL